MLVPPPADVPFTADDLIRALGGVPHGTDLPALQVALLRAIVDCGRAGVGVAELDVLREWVSGGGPAAEAIDRARLIVHASQGDLLADLFRRAGEHRQRAKDRTAAWLVARELAGIT